MSAHFDNHPEAAHLLALVDDGLAAEAAAEVRAHLDRCAACRRARQLLERERELVRSVLVHDLHAMHGDRDDVPAAGSVWPAVRARLEARARPRLGAAFAFGTATAAMAGVVGGILIGSLAGAPEPGAMRDPASVWSAIGATVADGDGAYSLESHFLQAEVIGK